MRRKALFVGVAGFVWAVALSGPAVAETVVTISKSQQRLSVTVDGVERHRWPVSTGRPGLATPSGTFRPIRFERKWYSRKYDMSPMPWSVFFHGGYAVHGTYETGRLGQAASHGCVRLLPANAAALFSLLRRQGKGAARIVVTDARLPGLRAAPSAPTHRHVAREAPQTHPVQTHMVSAGDEAAVLRGREAWLRSLDRKYGIVR